MPVPGKLMSCLDGNSGERDRRRPRGQ
jgi:hypothetical protein